MTKEVYLRYFKKRLIANIKKFGFIDSINPNKFYYKYYQGNDLKYKYYLCKPWLLYNTVQKFLILLTKVLIFTIQKISSKETGKNKRKKKSN